MRALATFHLGEWATLLGASAAILGGVAKIVRQAGQVLLSLQQNRLELERAHERLDAISAEQERMNLYGTVPMRAALEQLRVVRPAVQAVQQTVEDIAPAVADVQQKIANGHD